MTCTPLHSFLHIRICIVQLDTWHMWYIDLETYYHRLDFGIGHLHIRHTRCMFLGSFHHKIRSDTDSRDTQGNQDNSRIQLWFCMYRIHTLYIILHFDHHNQIYIHPEDNLDKRCTIQATRLNRVDFDIVHFDIRHNRHMFP